MGMWEEITLSKSDFYGVVVNVLKGKITMVIHYQINLTQQAILLSQNKAREIVHGNHKTPP